MGRARLDKKRGIPGNLLILYGYLAFHLGEA
jgi:hypothetical protein